MSFDWGRLRVWRSGKGPAVLALHGLGGSGRYWAGLHEVMPDRTLVAPDLAGFGRSSRPDLRYDREFHLEYLTELAQTLDNPVVFGHSVGGVLAGLLATRVEVGGLALLGTPFPRPELMPGPARRIALSSEPGRGRAATRLFRTLWPAASLATRATRRYPGALVSDYGRQSVIARADTMWTTLADLRVIEALAPLQGMTVRSMLMSARDDRYVTLHDLDRWKRLLPGAELKVVPSGGHQFLLRGGFVSLANWVTGP